MTPPWTYSPNGNMFTDIFVSSWRSSETQKIWTFCVLAVAIFLDGNWERSARAERMPTIETSGLQVCR